MRRALVVAAGQGKRFGGNKLFALLAGTPVLVHTLDRLQRSTLVDEIYCAIASGDRKNITALQKGNNFPKLRKIVIGGVTRFESVKKLLRACPAPCKGDRYIIHNGANPFFTEDEVQDCMRRCTSRVPGVAVGRPAVGTLKLLQKANGLIHQTIERENLWEMETPQVVDAVIFNKAVRALKNFEPTDDVQVLEHCGYRTAVSRAHEWNRKITTPRDCALMEFFLGKQSTFRVGVGKDSHIFGNGGHLTLGGVHIGVLPALEGDSDGDVMLHALCNALMSACGEGSLGTFATKLCNDGVSASTAYVSYVLDVLKWKGFRAVNCSFALTAARPAIDPLAPRIKKSIARLLGILPDAIGITATTGNGIGAAGRGKAIECDAYVSIRAIPL